MGTLNNATTSSQCAAILAWLADGHKITPIEALNRFGCFRLASRIHDLAKKGHAIQSQFVSVINAEGRKVKVKEYYL